MLKTIFLSVNLAIVVGSAASAQIKVLKKPAPATKIGETVVYDSWTMSWGLRDDANYPLGTRSFTTLEDAKAAAQRAIDSTARNGSWAITHVLIEGEPTIKGLREIAKDKAKGALTSIPEAKEAVDKAKEIDDEGWLKAYAPKERQRGDTLKEYGKQISDAYKRISAFKSDLLSGVGRQAENKFNEVNSLISEYNRQATSFNSDAKTASIATTPMISPITRGDMGPFPPASTGTKYKVSVSKSVNGQSVKQEDRALVTDDARVADAYVAKVKDFPGWSASSNAASRSQIKLEGRRGRGTFMDGVTPFNVEFRSGGSGVFSTADETFTGTW